MLPGLSSDLKAKSLGPATAVTLHTAWMDPKLCVWYSPWPMVTPELCTGIV